MVAKRWCQKDGDEKVVTKNEKGGGQWGGGVVVNHWGGVRQM